MDSGDGVAIASAALRESCLAVFDSCARGGFDAAASVLAEEARRIVGAAICCVHRARTAGSERRICASAGVDRVPTPHDVISAIDSISSVNLDRVLADGRKSAVPSLEIPTSSSEPARRGWMGVPVRTASGEVLAALEVGGRLDGSDFTVVDLERLEALARVIAPLFELESARERALGGALEIEERRIVERRERNRGTILEQLAKGRALTSILESIVALVEEESADARCSILLLSPTGRQLLHGAAPRLPEFYNEAIHGIEIGPAVGSCGAAAHSGKRIVVEDIDAHPNWAPYRALAQRANLRSCWSEPILASSGAVLGTFAIYHSRPRAPSARELEAITIAANLASIAIEKTRAEEERRRLEAQLLHAQKLESLGLLAGGIAHDFNNLLTSILGFSDLALVEIPEHSPARPLVMEAIHGARRAAELTKQMLAYSGKGRFVSDPVDLSSLVTDMVRLLEVSISKKCVLRLHLASGLPAIEADSVQLRQVIMNLIINASEAIGEEGGVISVHTGITSCTREELREAYLDASLRDGEYVYLDVIDSGCGMSDETKAKIFDPFFSTKFSGRGLGLSAVLGIVRGHGGAIKVRSSIGKGTTFRVLFPATRRSVVGTSKNAVSHDSWRGSGVVLIVDDEESVRMLATRMLEELGFSVLTANDGVEALEVFSRERENLRLVLLDLTMPRKGGEETLLEIRRLDPNAPVILSSGYSEHAATRAEGDVHVAFIQKPYRLDDLRQVVRGILSRSS